jgi:Fe-S-cluster-containing hydrogenase components 2
MRQGQLMTAQLRKSTSALDLAEKERSLRSHQWFKLICGASYHHLPFLRNLAVIYTLAGVDCIDMAADIAVVRSVEVGVRQALQINPHLAPPLLMISINDGEDPHFRKAQFDQHNCPVTCPQPCRKVCPTHAITSEGVQADLCYGCGRCLPVCPSGIITTYDQVYAIASLTNIRVPALEIHTQPHRYAEFAELWQKLQPLLPHLDLVSISCGDGEQLEAYLRYLLDIMQDTPPVLIWQTDGRPMSGDIGAGATQSALKLAEKVLQFHLPKGFVQLAGGTNHTTADKARAMGIQPHGYAYGSYARSLVADLLEQAGDRPIESDRHLLNQALERAQSLLKTVKLNVGGGSL